MTVDTAGRHGVQSLTMETIYFTHDLHGGSSVVLDAWYDSFSQMFFVKLKSDPDSIYAYEYVPSDVWEEYYHAYSLGSYYSKAIKPRYGPAVKVSEDSVMFVNRKVSPPVESSCLSPEFRIEWYDDNADGFQTDVSATSPEEAIEKFKTSMKTLSMSYTGAQLVIPFD